jgi:hypothetical protein
MARLLMTYLQGAFQYPPSGALHRNELRAAA